MPPFAVKRRKSVPHHDIPEVHAVQVLLVGDSPVVGMGFFAEQVKWASHVNFFSRLHIEQRQIHRASPRMA